MRTARADTPRNLVEPGWRPLLCPLSQCTCTSHQSDPRHRSRTCCSQKVSRTPRPAQRLPFTCRLCVSGWALPLSEPQVSRVDPVCPEARPHTWGCCRACCDRFPTPWPARGEGSSPPPTSSLPQASVSCVSAKAAFPAVRGFHIPSGGPILAVARAGVPGGWQWGPGPTQRPVDAVGLRSLRTWTGSPSWTVCLSQGTGQTGLPAPRASVPRGGPPGTLD